MDIIDIDIRIVDNKITLNKDRWDQFCIDQCQWIEDVSNFIYEQEIGDEIV